MINEKEIKNKILQDLIDTMEAKMVDGLKSKSPKFAKVEVEAEDPESLEDGLDKAKDLLGEDESILPMDEKMKEASEDSEEDSDMQRLMELYKQLK